MRDITLVSKKDLHGRTVADFIHEANKFRSEIWIKKDDKMENAKGLLGVLSLSVEVGSFIRLIADGKDEKRAISLLSNFLNEV